MRCATAAAFFTLASWAAAQQPPKAPAPGPDASRGAPATRPPEIEIEDDGVNAFGYPSPVLSVPERRKFSVGNAFFRRNWTSGPSSAPANDGLGPYFNARSCSGCHLRDGRSRPPLPGEAFTGGLLLRIGVPRLGAPDAPDPIYGGQLQDAATDGLRPEGRVVIREREIRGAYGDGVPFSLVAPEYAITEPAFGPPAADLVIGARTAPHLIGLGLLEAISAADLDAAEDPTDRDGDGVSGRVARLKLPDGRTLPGRFGWKATQPDVRSQTVAAFAEDLGLTSADVPRDPRPPGEAPPRQPELDAGKIESTVFYTRFLAPPLPRRTTEAGVVRGAELFRTFGCAACHRPEWLTGDEAPHEGYRRRTIRPYTDLLLHDLGPALADGKTDGDASPAEWRTPPLWGLGLLPTVGGHMRLLHDGRARGFAEAVLWHGGEATAARERFRTAAAPDRSALLSFLDAL